MKKLFIVAVVAVMVTVIMGSVKDTNAQKVYKNTPKVVTLYDHNEKVICHRKNKLVVNEALYWRCLGNGNGLTSHGYYISYNNHNKWYKKGRVYKTVLVYDIRSNWTDDVRDRSDYLASKCATHTFFKAVTNHA